MIVDPTQLMMKGRRSLRDRFCINRAAEDPMGLEAYKLAIGEGEIELGRLTESKFSFRLLLSEKRPLAMCVMKLAVVQVKGFQSLLIYLGWCGWFVLASVPALLIVLFDLLKYAPSQNARIQLSDSIFGLYPEVSGRTRPLFEALRQVNNKLPHKVIVLGRPRMSLQNVREIISKQIGNQEVDLVYPMLRGDFWLVLASYPMKINRLILRSLESGYIPTLSECIKANYRLLAGLFAQRWASRLDVKLNVKLWMCHTGLLDTSLLEQALQRRGVKTIHWVHGVSEGINFSGLSNYAVFRCEHDRQWHQQLGGYGQCLLGQKAEVIFQNVSDREEVFLLLTNYAHLMNYGYRLNGVKDECSALEVFADAAGSLCSGSAAKLLWKPHPVFYSLPVQEQQQLKSLSANLGFDLVDNTMSLKSLLASSKYVACTQSTIALDVLVQGYNTVLLCIQDLDPDYCLTQLPLKANDSAGLQNAWTLLRHETDRQEIYRESHSRIGPASFPTLEQVTGQIL